MADFDWLSSMLRQVANQLVKLAGLFSIRRDYWLQRTLGLLNQFYHCCDKTPDYLECKKSALKLLKMQLIC